MAKNIKFEIQKRKRRAARARAKIFGTANKPRLSIFRSNYFTYAQLIDDENRKTLVSASTREIKEKDEQSLKPKEKSMLLGRLIASKALEKGLREAVFDRGSYKYHGKVKAVAEGAREAGLKI